ncbi:MAG: hypothetical protein JNL01_14470 [Bdellovibrionales bacterium]|nr:hypothetical protein [Bdellovibrionales bacterium]
MLHLTAYRFIRLQDLPALKARILDLARNLGLMGTVLLAEEGVNIQVSGTEDAISSFKDFCRENFPGVEDAFKVAQVPKHVFPRFLVRIKKEIISLGIPDVRPDQFTGPRIQAQELKKWLDEGRPVTLLDTRNEYEVRVGTFRGAESFSIDSFREFGAKAKQIAQDPRFQDRPVVSFCTGGIRCEKASALLIQMGLKDVYQLDGGIIRYFEEVGAEHFEGSCFVFDGREAVDGDLNPVPRSDQPDEQFGRYKRSLNWVG